MVQGIIIDEEFKGLLPALSAETFKLLEENILQNGCRDSIILWGDTLIDGHNRYAICTKHDIPFNTISKDFDSREDALIWIISNQVSRRNLTPIQLSHFRGLHYRADKKKVGNNSGRNQYNVEFPQNGEIPKIPSTVTRLANQYNVSKNTIGRDAKIAEVIEAIGAISPGAKQKILTGDVKIDKKELERLAYVPAEEVAELVECIEDGTYEKRKPGAPATPGAGSTDGGGFGGGAPAGGAPAGELPLTLILGKISNDVAYYSGLRGREFGDGPAELKSALRSYIGVLEDLLSLI